jgi:very-short-patch-repair endonuclease
MNVEQTRGGKQGSADGLDNQPLDQYPVLVLSGPAGVGLEGAVAPKRSTGAEPSGLEVDPAQGLLDRVFRDPVSVEGREIHKLLELGTDRDTSESVASALEHAVSKNPLLTEVVVTACGARLQVTIDPASPVREVIVRALIAAVKAYPESTQHHTKVLDGIAKIRLTDPECMQIEQSIQSLRPELLADLKIQLIMSLENHQDPRADQSVARDLLLPSLPRSNDRMLLVDLISELEQFSQIRTTWMSAEMANFKCGRAHTLHQAAQRSFQKAPAALIAAELSSLKGIAIWHKNPENTAALKTILGGINQHLVTNRRTFSPYEFARCMTGLSGIQIDALPQDVQVEVAEIITNLAKKMEHLDSRSFGITIRALSMALQQTKGPVARATDELLQDMLTFLPRSAGTFAELGALCGGAIILSNARDRNGSLIKSVWKTIAAYTPKKISLDNATIYNWRKRKEHLMKNGVAKLLVKQAYAVYARSMPRQLSDMILAHDRRAPDTATRSKSENLVAKWISNYAGVELERSKFVDGFELDIRVKESLLNIEVDGAQHREPVKLVRDGIRDRHLKKKGWSILRIDHNASEEQVKILALDFLKRE